MPIETSDFVWLNGSFIPWSEAKTHVLDHALHYGTGVFEGIRAYKTQDGSSAVFRLKDHVIRLIRSAKFIGISLPYNQVDIERLIIETIKKNKLVECYIRPLVWYGFKELGLHAKDLPINFMIAVWQWSKYLGTGCVRTKISKWIRNNPNSFPSEAKICGGYVNSVLATREIRAEGYDEAIFLDHRGFISEGPGENIFIVKNRQILTPPLKASILPGITRDTVMKMLADKGDLVSETDITRNQLYNADEAFFTGTAAEVTPICEVDNIRIGDGQIGSVTKYVQEKYRQVIRGGIEKYRNWLSYLSS